MKTWILFLASCVGALAPAAHASEQAGRVTSVSVRASDGLILFYLDGTRTAKPACATLNYWMIKAENSEAGKRQFAALITARETGRQIKITGAGACTRWADGEDVVTLAY